MKNTKNYLRFNPAGNFNIIASGASNVSFVILDGKEGQFIAVAACEHVVIWDMQRCEKAQVLNGERSAVTAICASPNKKHLAVGYADGIVNIFNLLNGEMLNPYHGHDSAITSLAFDETGLLLASGSLDTEVVVWDLHEEKGLCRLSGHTKPITRMVFMSKMPILITASKDTHIKFWDLKLKYCFKTVVGIRSEVWSIALMSDEKYMVTAGSNGVLGIWKLSDKEDNKENIVKEEDLEIHEDDDLEYPLHCNKIGTVARKGKEGPVFMCSDKSGQILACHGKDKTVELFHFLSDEEAEVKYKKRVKKLLKKNSLDKDSKVELTDGALSKSVLDIVKRLRAINVSGKPKSLDVVLGRGNRVRLAVCMKDNELQLFSLDCSREDNEAECIKKISYLHGHQSDVRAVAFSSDNQIIASGSGECVKSWHRSSQARINSIETGSLVTTLMFAPGDRYVLAGTKKGLLLIIDIASAEIKEEIPAHNDDIRSICLTSDMRGVVTGSVDKTVKFWQFELIQDKTNAESRGKVLSLIHTRTLNLEDGVWCVRVSKNGKHIAVALSDSTVKIFFVDSFKLFLSLYGHTLPVITMDISSDCAIIATGSSDRNIKIWGMDYGNCHKSIFAHDDSVTGVQFVPGTHMMFSCGKDGKIKRWDADKFHKIQTIPGHIGEAYGMALSPNGKFVVSCGSDKVLRLFEVDESNDGLLEIEDEEEMERQQQQDPLVTGKETAVPGHGEIKLPSKKTSSSEDGADRILEALQACEDYKKELASAAKGEVVHLPMLARAWNVNSIDEYLMKVLNSIRASDMEQALLLLPFDTACALMKHCPDLLEKGHDIHVLMDIFLFLLKVHHGRIVQTGDLYETLEKWSKLSMEKLRTLQNMIGCNLHLFQRIQRNYEESQGETLFRDLTREKEKKNKERKKREKRTYAKMILNS